MIENIIIIILISLSVFFTDKKLKKHIHIYENESKKNKRIKNSIIIFSYLLSPGFPFAYLFIKDKIKYLVRQNRRKNIDEHIEVIYDRLIKESNTIDIYNEFGTMMDIISKFENDNRFIICGEFGCGIKLSLVEERKRKLNKLNNKEYV
jgi:hypothetical protein